MKTYAFAIISLLAVSVVSAQSQTFEQNNLWLEKQLNALTQDKKDKSAKPVFRLDGCNADMKIKTNDEGFNFGMSFGTTLDAIKRVDCEKDKGGYTLRLIPLKSGDESGEEDGEYSFSLKTDDEKLVKEIKRRLEANMAECRKMK